MEDGLSNISSERTQGAEEALRRYQERRKDGLRKFRSVSLSILVWGKTPYSDDPIARKRREIRDALLRLGHNAMFSEELCELIDEETRELEEHLSQKGIEFAQAIAADLIIILVEDSPGASGEFHDFGNHPKIAPNVYVMVPIKYKDGYSARGAIADLADGHGGAYWYEEQDFQQSNLVKTVIRLAEARRTSRMIFGDNLI